MFGKIGKALSPVSKLMDNPIVKMGLLAAGGPLGPASAQMATGLLSGGGAGSLLGGQVLGGLMNG